MANKTQLTVNDYEYQRRTASDIYSSPINRRQSRLTEEAAHEMKYASEMNNAKQGDFFPYQVSRCYCHQCCSKLFSL